MYRVDATLRRILKKDPELSFDEGGPSEDEFEYLLKWESEQPERVQRINQEIEARRASGRPLHSGGAAVWANGPTTRLRALQPGESALLSQYRTTVQMSSTIHRLQALTGARFRSELQRCLVYGTIEGVRVTRIA